MEAAVTQKRPWLKELKERHKEQFSGLFSFSALAITQADPDELLFSGHWYKLASQKPQYRHDLLRPLPKPQGGQEQPEASLPLEQVIYLSS